MNTINYVKGDVVKALQSGRIDYLIHCCNCQNNFGSGIAKQIKEEIPEAYAADCLASKKGDNKLGALSFNKGVVNLYGQEYYGYVGGFFKKKGRQVNYGAIASGLSKVYNSVYDQCGIFLKKSMQPPYKAKGVARVGLPYKFGCDRAGGDWSVMEELIEGLLCPYFEVYIYEL